MDYYTWKSIASAPACRAVRAGAEVWELPISFYSGGYSYTHGLRTSRGTCYVVSSFVMRDVNATRLERLSERKSAGSPSS